MSPGDCGLAAVGCSGPASQIFVDGFLALGAEDAVDSDRDLSRHGGSHSHVFYGLW